MLEDRCSVVFAVEAKFKIFEAGVHERADVLKVCSN